MAELTIKPDDIADVLRRHLEGFRPTVEAQTVGTILEVGDGIARVAGLPDAAVNELLEFGDGTLGLALNLEEESIGAVVLGESNEIEEGQAVKATGRILSVPVGDGMLGRVENTCAGMPTSSGLAPSSTRTATRCKRESDTGPGYARPGGSSLRPAGVRRCSP